MVETPQLTYEHTNGNTIPFTTNDLRIRWLRKTLSMETRPDGQTIACDANVYQRIFECSAILTATQVETLNTWMTQSITYDSSYPRLSSVYISGTPLTNIKVAITALEAVMQSFDKWIVRATFSERTA